MLAAALAVFGLLAIAATHWRDAARPSTDPSSFEPPTEREPGQVLLDYTGDLRHYQEGVHAFLHGMRDRFRIDAVIATLPALPAEASLEELAVVLVDRWRIGAGEAGRGLLLLLVVRESAVKLEVTYELEDVFTDAFTSHIERLQLIPNHHHGDLGTGLVAVMEEIERRAQLKQLGDYTPQSIARLDDELLSGGAGAKQHLATRETQVSSTAKAADESGSGARTPEEAWQVMLAKWAGAGEQIDVDVYTEMTKLAMGDPDQPDPRTRRSVQHWRQAKYEVRQDPQGRHAVIWFGAIEGWDNAPFLFCRTSMGWKFDIVHQRRLVVMGENPMWMVEQGDYPYLDLLTDAPKSNGKSFALPPEDRYSCQDDAEIAGQIRLLEARRRQSPDDIEVLTALLRLNVITGRRPNHVMPLVSHLKELSPDSPDVYKYAAIYHVNSFFQYRTALESMKIYTRLRPQDDFGRDFVRFLERRVRH